MLAHLEPWEAGIPIGILYTSGMILVELSWEKGWFFNFMFSHNFQLVQKHFCYINYFISMVPRLPSVQGNQMSQHKLSPVSPHVKHEMFWE